MALTENQIVKALEANGGFISPTAKALNVTYHAIYDRIQRSDSLKQSLEEIRESQLDMAESALLTKINIEKDLGAICFFLKCKGKKRGYIEKQQVDLTQSEGPLVIVKESE
jgi:hypothetical protein